MPVRIYIVAILPFKNFLFLICGFRRIQQWFVGCAVGDSMQFPYAFLVCFRQIAIFKKSKVMALPACPGPDGELKLPNDTGSITYENSFLTESEASSVFNDCLAARSWSRTPITFFGKSVLQPRDTAFFGTAHYSYSGERRSPTGWNEDAPASVAIDSVRKRIERHLNLPEGWFNVVLANKYYHGQDSMGYHSDDEASLGKEPIIASISLGAQRKFVVRPKKTQRHAFINPCKIEYQLANGSLLVMRGKMQTYFEHALPKVAISKCDNVRINLTYRRVV